MSLPSPHNHIERPATAAGAIPTDRVRSLATRAASQAARVLHAVFGPRRGSGFGILMYHRVAELPAGVSPPTYNVTPAQLQSQLAGLLAHGFQAWPLSKILEDHTAGEVVPRNVFAVTFDDGYENNLTDALPVLRRLNVPATIFLATAFLDQDAPFSSDDWVEAGSADVPARCWRPLTTAQCHELLASGLIELGAHSHTHGFFLGREAAFREDLKRCLTVLAERFGSERPPFAFPFGITSPGLDAVAREAGVSCALTTRFVCIRPGSDPFCWGRFNVADSDTAATLAAKLCGWYEPVAATIRGIKRPLAAILDVLRQRSGEKPAGDFVRAASVPSAQEAATR